MYSIKIEKQYLHFCAAHFVIFDAENREAIHGHNYYVTADFFGEKMTDGKLIDISLIKPVIREFCDELDHLMILPEKNKFIKIESSKENILVKHHKSSFSFPKEEVLLLPLENTTMECMAEYLAEKLIDHVVKLSNGNVSSFEIIIQETLGQRGSYIKTLK